MTDPTPEINGRCPLLPAHAADLVRSGLTPAVAAAAGVYSEPDPAAVGRLLGWSGPADALGPCLVFPYPDADGRPTGYARLKPASPRADRRSPGRLIKYEAPRGQPNRLYLPPGTRPAVADPAVPLLLTEGEKKALAADAAGFPCLGLAGVWAWQRKRAKGADGRGNGPRQLIPDLAAVVWAGRRAAVVFDSDAAANPGVAAGERELAAALARAGAAASVIRLPAGPGGAKQGLDDFLVANGPAALRALLDAPPPAPSGDPPKGDRPTAADQLARIAAAESELWHDAAGAGYATVGRRSLAVRSKGFRQWLIRRFRDLSAGRVPNAEAIGNAVNAAEAAAACDGPCLAPHVRVAGHDGRVYLHLADSTDTVIEVTPGGWAACDAPPVRFRHCPSAQPLPAPVPGGSLAPLRELLNLTDDAQFALLAGWLLASLLPDGPFPVLVLTGEQGAAKTTTARVLKALVDPSAAATRSGPKEVRDLMVMAQGGRVLVFDNLSRLPDWLSDALCTLATGGGFSTRELYTDDGETVFEAKRPVVLTSIEDVAVRGDLLDRAVLVRLPAIPNDRRLPEREFWRRFEAIRPALLGAVLDRAAGGLRELPGVRLARLPRMADFAAWAVACERAAGEPERFLAAYTANRGGAQEQALGESPAVGPLLAVVAARPGGWAGTATELLAELNRHAPDPRPDGWPRRANALTGALRRLAPALRQVHGLRLDLDDRLSGGASGGRRTRVLRIAGPDAGPSSPPSPPPAPDRPPGDDGDGDPPSPAPARQTARRRYRSDPNRGIPGLDPDGGNA
jgi:hypothetical protein